VVDGKLLPKVNPGLAKNVIPALLYVSGPRFANAVVDDTFLLHGPEDETNALDECDRQK